MRVAWRSQEFFIGGSCGYFLWTYSGAIGAQKKREHKKTVYGGGGGVNPPSGTVISASKTNKGKHKKEIQFAPKLDNISNI